MTIAQIATAELTQTQARGITDEIKAHTDSAWKLLVSAHEGHAWKPLGYKTWAEYVETEFNLTRSRSYHLIDQGRVIREIEAELSTKVDISEREARDIKPVLKAVVTEIRQNVAALGDEPKPAQVQAVVTEVIRANRPVTKVTDSHKEESYFDGETGEQVAPVKLPPAPKSVKPMKQQNAEQFAAEFSRSMYNLAKAATPEGRQSILDSWGLGVDGASPVMREYVTAEWFRIIARGLNALANNWEK